METAKPILDPLFSSDDKSLFIPHLWENQTLDEMVNNIILTVLEQENYNQSKAAKRLGINRATLYRKIKNHIDNQIEPN